MPVIFDIDHASAEALATGALADARVVASAPQLLQALAERPDEYAVVIGPYVPADDAYTICNYLRISSPNSSVILVRDDVTTDVLAAAMQAGARDVVLSSTPVGVEHAVERAAQFADAARNPSDPTATADVPAAEEPPAPAPREPGKVVTVWSPKGGVGKTTAAVNLALTLSERGKQVCLVDLDLAFGDVAITMQLFPTYSIEHAIGRDGTLNVDELHTLLTLHSDTMAILAAPTHPEVRERITASLITKVLDTLRETFDYIVVDTAPTLDDQGVSAMDASEDIVVVATLDVPTLKNVKIGLEALDELEVTANRHLLLNRADDEVGINADRIEGILGIKPIARISTSIDIAVATNAGAPIVLKNPAHPATRAIRELASHITGEPFDPIALASSSPVPEAAVAQQPRRLWKRR
ncbi:transcriptional regulator [Nocardioides baekrokdamisoli]|uniref:Transcriptional regulator n=1 Tax=Nocardioides baekrokdamisoli TaxID=1804624 RepID=A0A3G9J4E8_9ACTN|nr:AAA family ATPase [Nocardioides baekrokdamisoli]BBH18294.1 transcriptional regulator [Nocardioides baekrokdamisoli]